MLKYFYLLIAKVIPFNDYIDNQVNENRYSAENVSY